MKNLCQTCKPNQKLIITLNNALENKMYQIGRKDVIISTLCADLKKLDHELKTFQKPKAAIKKLNLNLQEVSQKLMESKAK